MAYQNQPNRVYFSSDDAKLNNEHSGNFTVKLDDPIVGAKKCNLVSCEYPSSFYNILPTDTLHFDEVYRDNTSGNAEVKRIRFSYKGLPEGNYTGSTLSTALSSALTYADTSSTPLVGVDADFTKFISSDVVEKGNLSATADNHNTVHPTNRLLYKKQVLSTTEALNKRLKSLHFLVEGSLIDDGDTNFGYVSEKDSSNNEKIVLMVELGNKNSSFWNGTKYVVDLLENNIDFVLDGTKSYSLGVILDAGNRLAGVTNGTNKGHHTSDQSYIDPIINLRLDSSNPFLDLKIHHPLNYSGYSSSDFSSNSTFEPLIYVETVRLYNYTYNNYHSTNHYTKAKLTVTYNDITKRFSIKPEKHPNYKDASGSTTTGNNFPFFKTQYKFLHLTHYSTLDSFLEIPVVENDRKSLNFILGANENESLSYVSSLDLTTNHALVFPHIPRLIRFPYVYLTCDFVNDSSKTGKNKSNILQKLPLSSEYGNVNFFNIASGDSLLYCDVSRDNIQTVGFSVIDKENNIVDLNGGEVSFTVNFEY